jgi:hypothetical protein
MRGCKKNEYFVTSDFKPFASYVKLGNIDVGGNITLKWVLKRRTM